MEKQLDFMLQAGWQFEIEYIPTTNEYFASVKNEETCLTDYGDFISILIGKLFSRVVSIETAKSLAKREE